MESGCAPGCQTLSIHPEVVEKVESTLPPRERLIELGDFFKIFGDATRIKILHSLNISEMCVCDIATVIGASQSAVSHQLKILRQANLVKYRKDGKSAIYSLADDHVTQILTLGLTHITE